MMQCEASTGRTPDTLFSTRAVHELITAAVVDVHVVVVVVVVVVVAVDDDDGGGGSGGGGGVGGGGGGGGGGLSQDVEVVVLVLMLMLMLMLVLVLVLVLMLVVLVLMLLVLVMLSGREAAVVVPDHVLHVGDVGDGHAQSLHLGQPLVAGLARHVLAQAQEGGVDGLHAPPLPGVPFGHQVHGLQRVRHVLVHGFLAVRTRCLSTDDDAAPSSSSASSSSSSDTAGALPRGFPG